MISPIARAKPDVSAPQLPALAPASSDRFWLAATAILVLGIAARQLRLGPAPFHPDEAIHAFFSMGFDNYHYDPVYHGPLLYHLVAGVFTVFGQYDFTARLMPSLLGVGLLALVLFPMRRFVGHRAALAGAALLSISPAVVTYSRHLLHDSLALFLTLGAVLCFAATLDNPSSGRAGRWARLGVAAFLTLFLATKANCFFILVMLGAFWLAWRCSGIFRLPVELERLVPALCFAGVTLGAVVFPRDNNSTLAPALLQAQQQSQHLLFQIVALSGCALMWVWLLSRRNDEDERAYKNNWFASGDWLALAGLRGRKSQLEGAPQFNIGAALLTYFLAAALALWLYVFLFGQGAQILQQWVENRAFPVETFAAGRESAQGAIGKMLGYWGGQQKTPRLPGRHDYYVVLALLYEVPILIAAAGGIWHAAKHRTPFTDLLLWWAFTSWAVYAVANEKVPWLLVHICLPLALLGGVWLGALKLPKPVWAVGLALGFGFCARGVSAMIFERAGDHAEPILYAQTPDAFRDSVEAMLADTRGDTAPLWMDSDRQWPSVWYFRKSNPLVGGSEIALGLPGDPKTALNPGAVRAGVAKDSDAPTIAAMKAAGWHTETANFLIWPRASWAALQPARYWRWFWTRDTLPAAERGLPQNQWKTSILAGKGEWSSTGAVIGWRKP